MGSRRNGIIYLIILGVIIVFCLVAGYLFSKGYRNGLVVKTIRWIGKIPGLKGWSTRFSERHAEAMHNIDRQIASLYGQDKRAFYISLFLEFLSRVVQSSEVLFMLLLFGIDNGGGLNGVIITYLHSILIVAFTTLFANLIGFLPMQLGVQEGGFVLSIAALGLSAAFGIFVSIICRVREIIWIIIGILLMNKLGEKRGWYYFIPAMVIWALFYYSGIHSTMSGVVMAFLVPMTPRYNEAYYHRKRVQYLDRLNEYNGIASSSAEFPNGPQRHCLRRMSAISKGAIPMSYRLEHALGPWVNFLIMPLFALANAGVEIPDVSYFNVLHFDPSLGAVSMGIFLGLLVGKPLGISLASFIAVKLHAGEMPEKASWRMLIAVACLGGIGFTMSIFVDTLSFGEQAPEITAKLRDMGKVAVLLGSLCAGILGSLLINVIHKIEARK